MTGAPLASNSRDQHLSARLPACLAGGAADHADDAGDAARKRVIALPGVQFILRLLLHLLPMGFKRIRPAAT